MKPAPQRGLLYLDSSAIVKLIASEAQTQALFEYLGSSGPAVTSTLARVEVMRAIQRVGDDSHAKAKAQVTFDRIAQIRIDESILLRASTLEPAALCTLDAIHLATALSLDDHLEALVAYDRRLAEAAELLGIAVVSPN